MPAEGFNESCYPPRMHHRALFKRAAWLAALALAACSPAGTQSDPSNPSEAPATGSEPASVAVVVPSEPVSEEPALATVTMGQSDEPARVFGTASDDGSVLAVSSDDPTLGHRDALVTLVVFGDIQCPFTRKVFNTLDDLHDRYSARDLRIVWKHLPLPFHKQAAPAAEASVAVQMLGGSRAFYCFLGELFDKQRSLDDAVFRQAAQTCGVDPNAMEAQVRSGAPARKVEVDKKTADNSGARGTPASFVNGVSVSGAQPIDKFVDAIDEEKNRAGGALAGGVSPSELHAHRVQANLRNPTARPSATPQPAPADTTVYKVPLGQSPALGSANALVTLVMFGDFQCPFSRRSTATIEQLRTEFGNDLRVVFKHHPLPFHKEAMPASQLSMEARVQKGNQGFWGAFAALFAHNSIDDAALEQVGQQLGLNMHTVRSAISSNRHRAAIDADIQLARQLGATGTPTFFINGRKLVGSQPVDKFRALINEVLADAKALTRRGVPRSRVYSETIKNGSTGPNKP